MTETTLIVCVTGPQVDAVLSFTLTVYTPGVVTATVCVVAPPGVHVYEYGDWPPVGVAVRVTEPAAEQIAAFVGVIATLIAEVTFTPIVSQNVPLEHPVGVPQAL